MNMDPLVVPEVFQKIERIDTLKEHRIQPKRAPCDQNWNNLSNEMNNVLLDYKAKYKINIHESALTYKQMIE